jgi:hypothetical protein
MKILTSTFLAVFLVGCSSGGGQTASQSSLPVVAPIVVPVVDLTGAGPFSVNEGQTLSLQLVGTDSVGNALTYSCTFGCAHAGITLNPATGLFVWTVAYGQSGTYNVTFHVTNGTISDDYSTQIVVNFVDQTPVFTNLGPQTITVGQTLTLVPNATEANGLPLTYSIATLPANAAFDGTTLTFTPDGTQIGTVNIDITADDGQGDTQTQTLVLTVQ